MTIADKLEHLERIHEAGCIGALLEALALCARHREPVPLWAKRGIIESLHDLAAGTDDKRQGRHRRWLTRFVDDRKDYARYELVLEARERGVPYDRLWVGVADLLKGSDAECGSDAAKKAYYRCRDRLESEPWRYYGFYYYRPFADAGMPSVIGDDWAKLVADIFRFDDKG